VQAGECDLGGWWLEPIQEEQFKNVKHVKIVDVRDHGYYFMNLNMRRKPFDDVAVRRAMAYATPKQDIVERLLEGQGEVTHSIVAPGSTFWHNPNVEKFEFSLERARRTLASAGYEWDEKGLIHYPAKRKG
jgi:peptide/nickel transport system substrate-binding protein